MKGQITNFRGSRHTKYDNHMIVKFEGIETRENATPLIGKPVSWKSPKGKEIKGKIAAEHGNKGCVRVIFEKGMPGQSIGNFIEQI